MLPRTYFARALLGPPKSTTLEMEQEKRVARNFLMIIGLVFLSAGCSKTPDMPNGSQGNRYLKLDSADSTMDTTYVDSTGDTTQVDTTGDSTYVDTTYLVGQISGLAIPVYEGGGCPWGSAHVAGGYSKALNAFGPSGELLAEGGCTIDSGHLWLKRGASVGLVGPAYYFKPSLPVVPVKYLRLKVRNVSGATGGDYNQMFTFHGSGNTWTWLPTASTYFDIAVVTTLPRCSK
jgi:hypothetical protein